MILDQFGRPYNASLENPAMSLDDPRTWDDVIGGPTATAGVRVTPRSVIGYPPIWRGVNLIAGSVAKLPLPVFKREADDSRSRDRKHPAYKLLRRKPNPWMTAFVFKRTLTFHAIFWGNGYAAIFRDRNGKPEELLILSPTETHPIQVNGELWYVTEIGGKPVKLRARDVLHIRGLSFDGLTGYALIEIMKEALGVGMAVRSYAAKFFGQGTLAGGVLMVPGKFEEKQMANLLASWEKMTEGLKKSHRVAILQDGAKWEKMTVDAEAAQMLQTQEHEVRMAANILQLPPHKLGDNSKSSYNSLEQENRAYLQDSLDPWLCAWESETDDKLLSVEELDNETHYCEFVRAALERTDSKNENDLLIAATNNGQMNLDEARAIRNLPPIPNGEGKKFRIPLNIGVIGEPAPAPTASAPGPSDAVKALVKDRLQRLIGVESSKALAAAKTKLNTPAAWNTWLDKFYAQFATWLDDALTLSVQALASTKPKAEIITAHVAQSKAELSKCTDAASVADVVATWPARAGRLLKDLQGKKRHAA